MRRNTPCADQARGDKNHLKHRNEMSPHADRAPANAASRGFEEARGSRPAEL